MLMTGGKIRELGNTGLVPLWTVGELKKFLLIFMVWLFSHCLSLPAPVSTRINILPLHSLFGEGEFSSIYWTEEMREQYKWQFSCNNISFLKGVKKLQINFFSQIRPPHPFIFPVGPVFQPFSDFSGLCRPPSFSPQMEDLNAFHPECSSKKYLLSYCQFLWVNVNFWG